MSLNPSNGGGNGSVTLEVDGDKVGVSARRRNQLAAGARHPAGMGVDPRRDRTPRHHAAAGAHRGAGGRGEAHRRPASTASAGSSRMRSTDRPLDARRCDAPAQSGATSPAASPAGWPGRFLGPSALAVVNALDQVTDVQLLPTPSVLVRNNVEATSTSAADPDRQSVTFNPNGNTNTDNTYSQVQYLETGVILKVRPRVTSDGMVFLDIVQDVSSPGPAARRSTATATCDQHRKLQDRSRDPERRDGDARRPDQRARRAQGLLRHPGPEPDPGDRRRCSARRTRAPTATK